MSKLILVNVGLLVLIACAAPADPTATPDPTDTAILPPTVPPMSTVPPPTTTPAPKLTARVQTRSWDEVERAQAAWQESSQPTPAIYYYQAVPTLPPVPLPMATPTHTPEFTPTPRFPVPGPLPTPATPYPTAWERLSKERAIGTDTTLGALATASAIPSTATPTSKPIVELPEAVDLPITAENEWYENLCVQHAYLYWGLAHSLSDTLGEPELGWVAEWLASGEWQNGAYSALTRMSELAGGELHVNPNLPAHEALHKARESYQHTAALRVEAGGRTADVYRAKLTATAHLGTECGKAGYVVASDLIAVDEGEATATWVRDLQLAPVPMALPSWEEFVGDWYRAPRFEQAENVWLVNNGLPGDLKLLNLFGTGNLALQLRCYGEYPEIHVSQPENMPELYTVPDGASVGFGYWNAVADAPVEGEPWADYYVDEERFVSPVLNVSAYGAYFFDLAQVQAIFEALRRAADDASLHLVTTISDERDLFLASILDATGLNEVIEYLACYASSE